MNVTEALITENGDNLSIFDTTVDVGACEKNIGMRGN